MNHMCTNGHYADEYYLMKQRFCYGGFPLDEYACIIGDAENSESVDSIGYAKLEHPVKEEKVPGGHEKTGDHRRMNDETI